MSRDEDLAEMRQSLASLDRTATRQQVILEEHMRRTAANEAILANHMADDSIGFAAIADQLKPIERHIAMWAGAGKVLVVAGALLGVAYYVSSLLK